MDITPFFKLMVDEGASDLYFTVGAPPHIKIEGVTKPVGQAKILPDQMTEIAYSVMNDNQIKDFEQAKELDMALSVGTVGRFRLNFFRQRGQVAMVVRYIKGVIPSIEELDLPPVLKDLVMKMRGLILIVGATGSGKSTTLASMIDYRNQHSQGHILTIEDPIEFMHKHKKSIVNQREVGLDTHNYANALKNAMREAPDVILIGEVRDRATMQHAISYAETGHLCLTTLHANNANQALDRIINFFPEDAKQQLLQDLSLNLRGIISQRLIPGVKNHRVAAVEVLINSPYISDLIEKGKVDEIKEVMARSGDLKMQTFDQALFDLYSAGKIDKEEAIRNADSANNVRLKIKMSESDGLTLGGDDLSIEGDEFPI